MSRRTHPAIEPCLPRPAKEPAAGDGWIHEIKHDGLRIMARRDARGVRLFTRNGYNFADRFLRIAAAVESLPVRSCFIDGEAIVVDANGLSVFDLIRHRQQERAAVLCAFDLIELDDEDLRRSPIEDRKSALAELLRQKRDGIALNAHYNGDGAIIDKHACKPGCEGIV
jgi:bifunctional non-homologous end joining protein LigD